MQAIQCLQVAVAAGKALPLEIHLKLKLPQFRNMWQLSDGLLQVQRGQCQRSTARCGQRMVVQLKPALLCQSRALQLGHELRLLLRRAGPGVVCRGVQLAIGQGQPCCQFSLALGLQRRKLLQTLGNRARTRGFATRHKFKRQIQVMLGMSGEKQIWSEVRTAGRARLHCWRQCTAAERAGVECSQATSPSH